MIFNYNNHNYRIIADKDIYDINKLKYAISLSRLSQNAYKAFMGEISYDVFVASDNENLYLFVEGKQFTFKKVNEDDINYGEGASVTGTGEIHAPMPGNVVKVLVKVGDAVEIGSPVLVIEAMKMESTLYSDIEGNVTAINVTEKEQVGTEKALIVIDAMID